MAERRMFAKSIIDSDAFLDMSLSTQALYFHLSMRADDDGFVNNPKKIMRMIGSSDDEMKILMAKKFLLGFESGVVVVKHWKIHNYIRTDRYNETNYKHEKALLVEDENKSYSLGIPHDIPTVNQMDTQVRLGKVRLGNNKKVFKSDKFDYFWNQYPKREGKKDALKHYHASVKSEEQELHFETALNNFKLKLDAEKTGYKFIPQGKTFFNNWEDYISYVPPLKTKTELMKELGIT